jgi:hypothetical protein
MAAPATPGFTIEEPPQLSADPTGTYQAGAAYWNTTLGRLRYYDGSAWQSVADLSDVTGSAATPTQVGTSVTYTLAANTQVVFRRKIKLLAGARLLGGTNSVLEGV